MLNAGITNGIDVTEWDPSSDEHISSHYTIDDLSGKVVIIHLLLNKMVLGL
ncbi:putative starch synthase [Helianthus anomalus]